jgi:hypothetical protein
VEAVDSHARWACRLHLEITDLRVERVMDIGEADAVAEGFSPTPATQPGWDGKTGGIVCSAADNFLDLFWRINKKSGLKNPWVWVVEFKVTS